MNLIFTSHNTMFKQFFQWIYAFQGYNTYSFSLFEICFNLKFLRFAKISCLYFLLIYTLITKIFHFGSYGVLKALELFFLLTNRNPDFYLSLSNN